MTTFSLSDLTLEDANIMIAALAKLPIEIASGTYSKVRSQFEMQATAQAQANASPLPDDLEIAPRRGRPRGSSRAANMNGSENPAVD